MAIKRIVLIIVSVLLLTGCTFQLGSTNNRSGTFVVRTDRVKNDTWTFIADSANGQSTKIIEMDSGNLTALNVTSKVGGGEASLIITQGETTRTIELSEGFEGNIDMQGFSAGKISLRLQFTKASDVNVVVGWIN